MHLLITIGLLLTPFSTSTTSGLPVVSFGLPFLALAVAVGFLRPSHDAFVMVRSIVPAMLTAAAAVLSITIFALFAPFPDRSLARVAPHLVCYVLAFLLIARQRQQPEELMRYALTILALSGAVLSIYYILHLTMAVSVYGVDTVMIERYTGGLAALPWGGTNVIAAPLIFPHAACLILRARYGRRWPVPVIALILVAVMLTTSRAGSVTHLCMLLFGGLLLGRYRALGAWVLALLLLLVLFAGQVRTQLDVLLSARLNPSAGLTNGRFDSFLIKWDYISHNIMSPVGYYGSMTTFDLSAHNIFLTVLVEQGLLGLGCMLAFIGACCHALFHERRLGKQDRDSRRVIMAGGILAFANLQVEDANFTQPYMIYFWVFFLVAMAFVMQVNRTARMSNTERSKPLTGAAAWPA